MLPNSNRSVVSQWNEVALEAIRLGDPSPTEITWVLHVVHSAMYDAWAAYDPDAVGSYFREVATGLNTEEARAEAISYAAFSALSAVLPDHTYLFEEKFEALGLAIDATVGDLTTASGVGTAAALTVVSIRGDDGSNFRDEFEDTSDYEPRNSDDPDDPGFDPNAWTPLRVPTGAVRDENGIPIATENPASYKIQQPISPHWGNVDGFVVSDSGSYLPPAPPKLGDFSEYVDGLGNVTTGDAAFQKQFGDLVGISANLTTEQKVIAEYWADGPQTSTPPGHWNEIAQDVSIREGFNLDDDVKFFFALNNALFDAGIAVWDAKYTYDFVRPQTAIRHLYDGETISSWAGPDQGTQEIKGEEWIPYQNVTFVTPAFPEYTSGHSGFSYAAATIIEAYTGSASYYDGTSRGAFDLDGDGEFDLIGQHVTESLAFENYSGEPITLQWNSIWEAAQQAGLSRLYGGIHIQDGDLFGRQIGAQVAEDVWTATRRLFDLDADNLLDASNTDSIVLGEGADRIRGRLEDLDALQVFGFGEDDSILISDLVLSSDGLSVSQGSAILELDQDGDGLPDAVITLEGEYEDSRFIAIEIGGATILRIATDADVELSDASERFVTSDGSANIISAGDGNDVLVSAGGGDILDGGAGDDLLIGGAEDDILFGGTGADTVSGGAGGDVFSFDIEDAIAGSGGTVDFIEDFQSGVDLVELSGYLGLSFDSLVWNNVEEGLALSLPNDQTIVFEGLENTAQLSSDDFVFPSTGRDILFAQSTPQILTSGDDRYISSGLNLGVVDAREGDDAIVTADADDVLLGGAGDDMLSGGFGDDTLAGGSGADRLTGGSGSDLFRFFGGDDREPGDVVADFITDFEVGIDTVEVAGFFGITEFADIGFLTVEAGVAAVLGGDHFVVFEGIFNTDQLEAADFEFGDTTPPELSVDLIIDTGTSASDGLTNSASISGLVTDNVQIQSLIISRDETTFFDIGGYVGQDGRFRLEDIEFEEIFGQTLQEGDFDLTLRATDATGLETDQVVSIVLDRTAPTVVSAPSGTFSKTPNQLTVELSEAMSDAAFDVSRYDLFTDASEQVEITSVERISSTTARLVLADRLPDGAFSLTILAVEDLASNTSVDAQVSDFIVEALTTIISTGPTAGSQRTNLDREIVIEFDRPIDPTTVTSDSFQVIALGEPLEGRISVSSNGQVLTFFPDGFLPAATQLRIKLDGDAIKSADGKSIDASGNGEAGGQFSADFQTISLTRVENTNIEGFIFDANYRDEDGLDIPLEGVIVSVVGLEGVSVVTDSGGRFFLEDMPIPQVYLDFDASNVVNRSDFDYGTIVKPVDTSAGQTVGLESNGKGFSIYFAALNEGDVTEIVAGQATEAGIGENGLANLAEIFPNIDASEWGKLKVTIPMDSLSFDDGSLAEEVSVMVFEPDRIPAPLPAGFDPTVVFTVKAGDAKNVDGRAQIDFPNIDNLEVGAKRPILSFDHDAGEWVQSGTAIVVDDGNGGTVLRSEGDTGVNTLGWKGIGKDPQPNTKNENSEDDDFWEFFNDLREGAVEARENLGDFAEQSGLEAKEALGDFANLLSDQALALADSFEDFYDDNLEPIVDEIAEGARELAEEARQLALGTAKEIAEAADRVGNYLSSDEAKQNYSELGEILLDTALDTASILGLNPAGPSVTAIGLEGTGEQLANGYQNGNTRDLAEGASELIGLIPPGGFAPALAVVGQAVGTGVGAVAGAIATAPAAPATGGTSILLGSAIGAVAVGSTGRRAGFVAGLAVEGVVRAGAAAVNVGANVDQALDPLGNLYNGILNAIKSESNSSQEANRNELQSFETSSGPFEFKESPQALNFSTLGQVGFVNYAQRLLDKLVESRALLEEAASYEGAIEENSQRLDEIASQLADFDDQFVTMVEQADAQIGLAANLVTSLSGVLEFVRGASNPEKVLDNGAYSYLVTSSSGFEVRGTTNDLDDINFGLQNGDTYVIRVINELTQEIATRLVIVGEDETEVRIEPFIFLTPDQVDTDDDGLVDVVEEVLGTQIDNADTDGDGIQDGAEIAQGLNPLDGIGFPTGLIGNVSTKGNALDVELTGSLDGLGGQTAYVATGDHGLAIIDASQFSNPILQSELDLPGENSRIAVDAARGLVYVASTVGLHIVDVQDAAEPSLVQTLAIPGGAQSLLFRDDLLFVGGRDLYVVNPAAGAILTEIDTLGPVKDIAASGDTIFAIVDNSTLVSYAFNGRFLVELDSVDIPTPPIRRQPFEDFRIFVSDDVAYVSNGFDLTLIAPTRPLERAGYVTFDVADATNLALISNIDTPAVQGGNLQTVTNGAGLGLIAAGRRGIQIHDTNDAGDTYELIAEFDTPGNAQAVALASGIAYVADGVGGLQVINFLPFDADGQAPVITLNSSASDADPSIAGIQVEEGETIRLDLGISDDVQIRNVELLVNGQVVLNDVSAPYELAFFVPSLSSGATVVEIAVRATDTGGNATVSDSIVFGIIPDITAPEVFSISPTDGRLILVGESTVSISFSEPVDLETISANTVTLTAETGEVFAARDFVLLSNDQVALFTFEPFKVGDYTLNLGLAGVSDRAGNPIETLPVSQSLSVVDATAVWSEPAGGDWFRTENWRDGLVPEAQDGVAISVSDGFRVEISRDVDVDRLLLQGELQLRSGIFSTDSFEGNSGSFIQTGGTVVNTLFEGADEFNVTVTSGVWRGVDLDVSGFVGDTFGRRLDVYEGLTVDGSLSVEGNSHVGFYGSQLIDGSGTIELTHANSSYLFFDGLDSSSVEVVTFGPDLTLQGQGYVSSRNQDRFQFLGDVIGVGGELRLNYIDNAGAALSLDSAGDGWVTLQTAIENAAVEVALDADVRVVSGDLTGVSLGGAGTTRIERATVSDLTVLGRAEIEALSSVFTFPALTVTDNLTVSGTLALSGTNQRAATLAFTGGQTVDGAGEIVLSRGNAIGDETVINEVRLISQLSEREDLVFGADLTLRGTGTVTGSSLDRVQILGDVIGEGGDLILRYVDNQDEVLTVDPGAGLVRFGSLLENTVVTTAQGAAGYVGFESNLSVRNTTFNSDARLEGANFQLTIEDAVTVNGTFEVAAEANRSTTLTVDGEQTLDGTGEIVLSRANLNPEQVANNNVRFQGDLSGTAEVLTFGADLGLSGAGIFSANQSEDSLRILGQVTGLEGHILTLRDVDNAGAALNIDASAGVVRLGAQITDTVIAGLGDIELESNTRLSNVTLGVDATIGTATTSQRINATEGLIVDANLTLGAPRNGTAYLELEAAQTLGGSGTIVLSNVNAPLGSFTNAVIFDGALSATETLTIAQDLTIRGQGQIYAQDTGDDILLEGAIIAEGGVLNVDDLQGLEGLLGASSDGVLDIDSVLALTERGTLTVGLSGAGSEARSGLIDVSRGTVALEGTLALDIADDFVAQLGDTFDIFTAANGFTGSFDAYQGFNLDNNLAFKLNQSNPNTLTLEVTMDVVGQSSSSSDIFSL